MEKEQIIRPGWIKAIRSINHWISNLLDRIAGGAAVVLCTVMTIVVLLGVFYRYVLVDPVVWSEELSTFAMVWLAMTGGSMGIKRCSHVGVSYVVDNIGWLKRNRNAVGIVVNVLILSFLLVLVYQANNLALFARMQISSALGISMFWPYLGLIVGGWMMVIQVLCQIVDAMTGGAEIYVDECCLGEEQN